MSKKLYEALRSEQLYTKSYEDFQSQFSTEEKQKALYESLAADNLYTKSYEDFSSQFWGKTNDSAIVDPNVESSDMGSELEDGSSVLLQRFENKDFGEEEEIEPTPKPTPTISNMFTHLLPEAAVDMSRVDPEVEGKLQKGIETTENFLSDGNLEYLNESFKALNITFKKGGGNSMLITLPGMKSSRAFKMPTEDEGLARLKWDILQYIQAPQVGANLPSDLDAGIDKIWDAHSNSFWAEENMEEELSALLGGGYSVESAGKLGNSFTVTRKADNSSRTFYVGGSDKYGHKNTSDELKLFLLQPSADFESTKEYKESYEEIAKTVREEYLNNPVSIKDILKKSNIKDFYSIATAENKEALIDYVSSELTHEGGRFANASANITALSNVDINSIIREVISNDVDIVWNEVNSKRANKELSELLSSGVYTPEQIESISVNRHTGNFSMLEKEIVRLNLALDKNPEDKEVLDTLEIVAKQYNEEENDYIALFDRSTGKLASINQADEKRDNIINITSNVEAEVNSLKGVSREDLKIMFNRYSLALAEFEDETKNLKEQRSFYSLDFTKYSKSKPIGKQSDKFDTLIEQKVDLITKIEALKRAYLLNESILSVTKDDASSLAAITGKAFAGSLGISTDGSFIINNGIGEAQAVAAMHDLYLEAGVPMNKLVDKHVETGFDEHLAEIIGGLPVTLAEFTAAGRVVGGLKYLAGITKYQQALKTKRFVRGNKIIPKSKIQEGAKNWGRGKSKFKGLSAEAIEGQYIHAMGISVKAPSKINQAKSVAIDLLSEGVAFSLVERDIEGLTKGAAFGGFGKLIPPSLKTKLPVLDGVYKFTVAGVKMAGGNEAGAIANAAIKHVTGQAEWSDFMEEHYSDLGEVGKRIAGDLIVGAGLGVGHLTRFDFKSLESTKKARGEYIRKIKELTDANGNPKKGQETKVEDLYDLLHLSTKKINSIENLADYYDPLLAPTKAAKDVKGAAKDFKELGYDLKLVYDIPIGGATRKGEYKLDKANKTIEITINPGKITPGVISHEIHHPYMELLMGHAPTKAATLNKLLNVTKQIRLKEGEMLYDSIKDIVVRKYGDLDLAKVKEAELFAYISEAIRNGSYVKELKSSKGFSKLRDWINSNGEMKTQTRTVNDIINWFGTYHENIGKGHSNLSHFKKLNELIESFEGGEVMKVGKVDVLGNVHYSPKTKEQLAENAREVEGMNNLLKALMGSDAYMETSKGLASEDLNEKRRALLRARQEVATKKPEGWETTVKYFTKQINKVKEEIADQAKGGKPKFTAAEAEAAANVLLGGNAPEIKTESAESAVARYKKNTTTKSAEISANNKRTVKSIKSIPNINQLRQNFKEIVSLNKALNKHERHFAEGRILKSFIEQKRVETKRKIAALKNPFPQSAWEGYSSLRHRLVMDNLGLVNKLAFLESQRSANVDAKSRLKVREELIYELGSIVDSYSLNKQARNPKGELLFTESGNPVLVEFGAYASLVLPHRVPAAYERLNIGLQKGVTHKDLGKVREVMSEETSVYDQIDSKHKEANLTQSKIDLVERFKIDKVDTVIEKLTNEGVIDASGKLIYWDNVSYNNLKGLSNEIVNDILFPESFKADISAYRAKEKLKGYKSKGDPRYATSGPNKNLGAMIYLTKSDAVFNLFRESLPEFTVDPVTGTSLKINTVLQQIFYKEVTDPNLVSKSTGRILATAFSNARSLTTGLKVGNRAGNALLQKRNITRKEFLDIIKAREIGGEIEFTGTSKSNFTQIVAALGKELERAITNQITTQAIRRGDINPKTRMDYHIDRVIANISNGKGQNLASETVAEMESIVELIRKSINPTASNSEIMIALERRLGDSDLKSTIMNLGREIVFRDMFNDLVVKEKDLLTEANKKHLTEASNSVFKTIGKFDSSNKEHTARFKKSEEVLSNLIPNLYRKALGIKETNSIGFENKYFNDINVGDLTLSIRTQKKRAFHAEKNPDSKDARAHYKSNEAGKKVYDAIVRTFWDFVNDKTISKTERVSRLWVVDSVLKNKSADGLMRLLSPTKWIDIAGVTNLKGRYEKIISKTEGGKEVESWMEHFPSNSSDASIILKGVANKTPIKNILVEGKNNVKGLLRKQASTIIDNLVGANSSMGIHKVLTANLEVLTSIREIGTGRDVLQYLYNHPSAKELFTSKEIKEGRQKIKQLRETLTRNNKLTKTDFNNFKEWRDYADNLDTAFRLGSESFKKKKGISVWDFDDTLAKSKSNVLYKTKDGRKGKLTPAEFASKGSELLKQGFEFDFSEFNKVIEGEPGPFFKKFVDRIKKFGVKDNFILTARPAESALAIKEFLKSQGIDIPLKNITGLANSTAEAKAAWMVKKAAEGYNDFYFADDATKNVKAVADVLSKLDVKSKVQQANRLASEDLNLRVNQMIERVFDIPADKVMSGGKGRGVKDKDYKFGGHGISDFELLTYRMFGKGKEGERDQAFIKEHITKPYLRGRQAMHRANEKIAQELLALNERNKDVVKSFKDPIHESFTKEQAMRVYLWTKTGQKIPELTGVDQTALVEAVIKNPRLRGYADVLHNIGRLGTVGWVKPTSNWHGETLKHDMFEITHGNTGRTRYLKKAIDNMDTIFSTENLNKLEAALGHTWKTNMKEMLGRMKTGSSRNNLGKKEQAFVDWFNGAAGVTMHLNMRSALTQSVSMLNYVDLNVNNPLRVAEAVSNPKQLIQDFMEIINSDYLRQRRKGGVMELSISDIAEVANNPTTSVGKALIAKLLSKGYAPTKWMDSFAISLGGAPYYRNHVKHFLKEGHTKKEAERLAWEAFVEKTEPLQQSSDQMFLSAAQSTAMGRILFTYKNTPVQMYRQFEKARLDLKNRRGDALSNVAKMAYYGPLQSTLFYMIQSSMWTALFDDEEITPEQRDLQISRVASGVLGGFLQGTGVTGNVAAMAGNTALAWYREHQAGFKGEKGDVYEAAAGVAPTVGTKMRQLGNIYDTFSKFNANYDISKELGFDIHNPFVLAGAEAISFARNIPLDRYVIKARNVEASIEAENLWWQRIGHFLGFKSFDLGTEVERLEKAKRVVKKKRKRKSKIKAKRSRKKFGVIVDKETN